MIIHTFEEIISVDNLLAAWAEFTQGKRKRADVRLFSRALLHNILLLHDDLRDGTYVHSGYERFCITDPKPRVIHKATVRDRVLHRAIYRLLYPIFDKTFIYDSYSCRDNKGTHKAFQQLVTYTRTISQNYTMPCFALKMDIRKFFDSIDHKILQTFLEKHISDLKLLDLLEKVITSFEVVLGKGLPLGNLTSQLFANVYMDCLDKFVKHRLKARHYLRYADDFIILSTNPDELMGYFIEVNHFIKNKLDLSLHPNKISLRKLSQGIDFVGYVARPYYTVPRRKTVRRMFSRLSVLYETKSARLEASTNSYLGYLSHVNAHNLSEIIKVSDGKT